DLSKQILALTDAVHKLALAQSGQIADTAEGPQTSHPTDQPPTSAFRIAGGMTPDCISRDCLICCHSDGDMVVSSQLFRAGGRRAPVHVFVSVRLRGQTSRGRRGGSPNG